MVECLKYLRTISEFLIRLDDYVGMKYVAIAANVIPACRVDPLYT